MKTNKLLKSIMLGGLCTVALLAYAEQDKVINIYSRGKVISTYAMGGIDYFQIEESTPAKVTTYEVNGVIFDMVEVEGGNYLMGDDNSTDSDEKPAHKETIATFQIGQTEVTQELWQAVMGTNPSKFKGEDNLPVEQVSWTDCNNFINKLNELTGKNFRLPSEAEWEYAAGGGTKSQGYTYSGSNAIEDVAWYRENSSSKSHPVAQKKANELGIYDMTGNVWEWTSDNYSEDYSCDRMSSDRIYRGGSWHNAAISSRVANRDNDSDNTTSYNLGLRLAL
ncbi:MAG: formylglycine-generating enzyme family protein [Bacteroides sp.]|nr:formylglycine-generating enzyme family protein [Bacteroides sp.]MBD5349890.1 formylglycine-generating enzyme family protein [Bacteroides sp.]